MKNILETLTIKSEVIHNSKKTAKIKFLTSIHAIRSKSYSVPDAIPNWNIGDIKTNLKSLPSRFKREEKSIVYHKNGILVRQGSTRFIRIACISEAQVNKIALLQRGEYTRINKKLHRITDERINSIISESTYYVHLDDIREYIPVHHPRVSKNQLESWVKDWRRNYFSNQLVQAVDYLVVEGTEIHLIPYKMETKDILSTLIVLVEYGPSFPNDTNIDVILQRNSILNAYKPLSNINKIFRVDEQGSLERLRYLDSSHSQLVTIHLSMISRLLEKNHFTKYSTDFKTNLSKYFSLSRLPGLAVGSIVNRLVSSHRLSYNNLIDCNYLLLNPGSRILVNSSKREFKQFIEGYQVNSGSHKLIIFSNRPWDFERINFSDMRLSLISFGSDENVATFVLIYVAIDLLFGNTMEAGGKDIIKFIKFCDEYDINLLGSISSVNEFEDLLRSQLGNNSYLTKHDLISKIYQTFIQYHSRTILNPINSSSSSIFDFQSNLWIDTAINSTDAFLNIIFIIIKLQKVYSKENKPLHDFTIVIDDDRLVSLLQKREIYALLSRILSGIQGLRLILHQRKHVRIQYLDQLPVLQINVKAKLRLKNVLSIASASYTINPVKEVIK
ncbi:MAG: hypothetical protein INQ03_02630 [Candidatus Heimdallarchaeota archaeon]|nr:hypothetical protein [Candidatus Heimdallarchaeota archaeon]